MRVEIRGNQVLLDGYVNAVERESRILPSPRGRFIEKIKTKTFERALSRASDVSLLFNHSKDRKLGSIQMGNLELFEDSIGLRAIATVTDEEIVRKAQNKELRGWSFGFSVIKDQWSEGEDGIQRRTLEDIELLEVSILDKTPAYIATSIEARGEDEALMESRSYENKVITDVHSENDDESRGNPIDYSVYEKQIELLKLKGGK